ncbi:ester cyclase [Methylorubrum extorquens]
MKTCSVWSSGASFPNGRVHVLQQIIAGGRVVSHLRITGRFLGLRDGVSGQGQLIDYLATDIMRIVQGRITDNWHVEDHESLHRQLR